MSSTATKSPIPSSDCDSFRDEVASDGSDQEDCTGSGTEGHYDEHGTDAKEEISMLPYVPITEIPDLRPYFNQREIDTKVVNNKVVKAVQKVLSMYALTCVSKHSKQTSQLEYKEKVQKVYVTLAIDFAKQRGFFGDSRMRAVFNEVVEKFRLSITSRSEYSVAALCSSLDLTRQKRINNDWKTLLLSGDQIMRAVREVRKVIRDFKSPQFFSRYLTNDAEGRVVPKSGRKWMQVLQWFLEDCFVEEKAGNNSCQRKGSEEYSWGDITDANGAYINEMDPHYLPPWWFAFIYCGYYGQAHGLPIADQSQPLDSNTPKKLNESAQSRRDIAKAAMAAHKALKEDTSRESPEMMAMLTAHIIEKRALDEQDKAKQFAKLAQMKRDLDVLKQGLPPNLLARCEADYISHVKQVLSQPSKKVKIDDIEENDDGKNEETSLAKSCKADENYDEATSTHRTSGRERKLNRKYMESFSDKV